MMDRAEVEQATLVTDEEVPTRLAQIIRLAKKNVVLVSPYVNDWKRLYDWLPPAVDAGKHVVLIVRRDTDRNGAFTYGGSKGSDVLPRLSEQGVEIRWADNLHSKVYLNEREVFVTSMNLLSSSAADSKEIGLSLIQGANVTAAREYVQRLIELSKPYTAPAKPRSTKATIATNKPRSGSGNLNKGISGIVA